MRPFARATLSLAALAALSCAHRPKPPLEEDPGEYRIGREDLLDISVWQDADLSRTVPVRPDGRISVPLLGEMEAAGKTPQALAREISGRLKPYMQDPRVVVILHEVNAPRVFVIGEVAHPGPYPLKGRLSLLQALSLAGGPNEFADRSGIVVIRPGKEPQRYEVDYGDLVEAAGDFPLRPGDTVYVP